MFTIAQQLSSGALLKQHQTSFSQLFILLGFVHLWFLYYLMIFYVTSVALISLLKYIPAVLKNVFLKYFETLVTKPAGIIIFMIITFFTMLNMQPANAYRAGFEYSPSFLPPLRDLAAYYVFFVFGWLLFKQQIPLTTFCKNVALKIVLGLCATGCYAFFLLNTGFHTSHLLQCAIYSIATWLLVLGVMGLFFKYAYHPNPVNLYLSEASYWIYIFHLPITLFLPGFLIGVPLPGMLKFLLVFGGTMALSLFTYHYFVRANLIGKVLNGRRFPRSLPILNTYEADNHRKLHSTTA